MSKNRLEAFSDAVIAILMTIMVLELKTPRGTSWDALAGSAPTLLAYVLSFVVLGIYWNNHHHLLHATHSIDGAILWANLHLLFWLSLIPFTTAWMGENHVAALPTAGYAVVLLFSAVAYIVLQTMIIARCKMDPEVIKALRKDVKGRVSLALYFVSVPLAFVHPAIAWAIFAIVALIWLIPDRRIETALTRAE